MRKKIIGILGGMGPYASAYFYKLLLDKSRDLYGAKNNEDYPEILIDSVPIFDFISNTKNLRRARKIIIERINKMNDYGVSVVGMTCNTAHILYPDLALISKADFVSMIEAVVGEANALGLKKVGLLATPTTISQGIYHRAFSRAGITCINDGLKTQKLHEQIIREVIAGKKIALKQFNGQIDRFIREQKLEGVILGCTELPLVFPQNKFPYVIDCLDVLANKLLEKYYN